MSVRRFAPGAVDSPCCSNGDLVHILFLTDNFPPEVNAPASRTFEHCREWVKAGHRVTVITCAPNFPKGKVFDGYSNRLWQRERMDGIEVIRVWSYITANEGFSRRVLDYLSFMFAAILAAPWVRGVDVVIGTSPQFFTACAAYVVGLLKRVPYVFELRDLWPESIKAVGAMQDSRAIRLLERLELFLYRKSAAVVSVTDSFKRVLVRRGIEASKIHVVTNGVDISQFRPRAKDPELTRSLGLEGKFVAGYIGTHGMAHALETLLEAAKRVRGEGFAFVFLGDGARKQALRETARKLELDNVIFIDSVPKGDVARFWSLLDVSVIHLRKTELFTTVIPSKLFECMGMGIPVLHGVEGESAEIVREHGVGVPFPPEDVDALVSALRRCKGSPDELSGFRSRCLAAAGKFDRKFLAMRMLKDLESVANRRTTASPDAVAALEEREPLRVLMLNQTFWPDVAATAQHAFDLAKYLAEHGDKVTVIASRSIYGQAGSVLPGSECVDGVEVHRVTGSFFGKGGIASRSFDFLAFNVACLLQALSLPRHDVVICLTTPPFIALVGLVLRWTKGSRFIFWTMDLYPDVPLAAGVLKRGSMVHRLFDRIDRYCLRNADAVVVLGRCMRARILAKGVDPRCLRTITPWADPQEVPNVPVRQFEPPTEAISVTRGTAMGVRAMAVVRNGLRDAWGIGDRFVIEYSGNCGVGHDISSVCDAMLRLKYDDGIRWVFVGGGVMRPRIEEFIERNGIQNVVMRPYQPRSRLGELIALGDAHLVLVADGFEGLLIPSKFYGILAAGRPTIYVGPPNTEVAEVISSEDCGFVVENGSGASLVEAITVLRNEPLLAYAMGLRGRRALEHGYAMRELCGEWRRLLQSVGWQGQAD
jgi:glycosyltransferase involved in cell wall biosynthesis